MGLLFAPSAKAKPLYMKCVVSLQSNISLWCRNMLEILLRPWAVLLYQVHFFVIIVFFVFFIIDFVSRLAIFLTAPSILWKFRLHHANLSDIYLLKVVVVNVFFDFQAVRQMKETQLTLLLQSTNQRPLTIRNRWDQLSDISWFS